MSGERLQRFQNAANAYREFAERWNQETVRRQKLFSEHYREGDAAIVYQLEFSMFASEEKGSLPSKLALDNAVLPTFAVLHKKMFQSTDLEMRLNNVVLVPDVQLMESPNEIPVPSLVGLYDLALRTRTP